MNKEVKAFLEQMKAHGLTDKITAAVNLNPPPACLPAEIGQGITRGFAIKAILDEAAKDTAFRKAMFDAGMEALFDEVFTAVPLTPSPDFTPTPEQLEAHKAAMEKAERMAAFLTGGLGKSIFM